MRKIIKYIVVFWRVAKIVIRDDMREMNINGIMPGPFDKLVEDLTTTPYHPLAPTDGFFDDSAF